MTQAQSPLRNPILTLRGPIPSQGVFCYTCCSIYLGAINVDPTYTADAQELVNSAREAGLVTVDFELPSPQSIQKQLRYAVSVGPSYQFPNVLAPVCWTHLIGYQAVGGSQRKAVTKSPLIAGKSISLQGQMTT